MKERALADELLRLRQRHLLGIDLEDEIEDHEERLMEVRGEIVENAMEKIPRKYRKRYSGCARRCLNALTVTILKKERNVFPPKAKDEKEVLKRLLGILRTINGANAGGGAG
ncbi:MAG: hypothetical protein QXI18_02830 [Nitrososphaerota archaeon]